MPTLLYAEDRLDEGLVEVLEEEGFTVLRAENGGQALDELKTRQVDVILLDIMMPPGDGLRDDPLIDEGFKTGLGVLRWLEKEGKTIPVVVLSANPSPAVRQEAERSSLVCKFIAKGGRTSLPEIIATLHDSVGGRSGADGHHS
jgi:CheY-like chemotaxis protein